MKASGKEKQTHYRVVTFLNRSDLDFLDELEKDIYFTRGIHIPRARLIEEIIEGLRQKGTKEAIEAELLKRFKEK